MIVNVKGAYKSFGSLDLFEDLSLSINENEKVALIGANGVGKTTLFRVLAQQEFLDKGDVFYKSGIRFGFLDQINVDTDSILIRDYIYEVFTDLFELKKRLEAIEIKMVDDHSDAILKQYDRIQNEFMSRGGYTYETDIHSLLTQFGFSVSDLDRDIKTFSGGQVTRLAFIRLLLSKPDILFLDEPTNHLDIHTIEWLESYLKNYEGAVVVVSHDRLFLDRVCNVLVEIEDKVAIRYETNYTGYLKEKEVAIERHNIKYQNQQKEIKRLEDLIEKFRYKKNKAAFAQSKIKYLDRMDKLEERKSSKREFKASFKANIRGGKDVLTVDNLEVGYTNPLFKHSQIFERGRRYAIIGENGSGKSTFLKTLAGKIPPMSGEMLLGHQIEMGYFDQQLLDFSMHKTVLEEVWDDFPELTHTEIRSSLGRFLFKQDDVFKSVSVLSGGERVRLSLVKLMLAQDNLLILDEPTNHLDIPGKEALEKALLDYDGTMIFVSHDRYFIEAIATDILYIKEGQLVLASKQVDTVLKSEKKEQKDSKETNKLTYQVYKKMQRQAKKLEETLLELEEQLALHRELRFDPEYYHDHEKMSTLDQTIDDIHIEIKQTEETWTQISIQLETYQDES